MNNRLEQFIRDHREEFDADEPGKKIWEKIEFQLEPGKKDTVPVIWMSSRRWVSVAAVCLLMAGSVWYFSRTTNPVQGGGPGIASNNGAAGGASKGTADGAKSPATTAVTPADTTAGNLAKTTPNPAAATDPASTQGQKDRGPQVAANTPRAGSPVESSPEADYKEEMYHYARLVEIKHKELKTIEKDEPLLYRQFAGDVNKLDSTYRLLEKQLPQNPNREQLLEAMLQNLQLQMGLLNHQLDIIKQINNSKKKAYDKAYKTA
jgi:hypothetical protein